MTGGAVSRYCTLAPCCLAPHPETYLASTHYPRLTTLLHPLRYRSEPHPAHSNSTLHPCSGPNYCLSSARPTHPFPNPPPRSFPVRGRLPDTHMTFTWHRNTSSPTQSLQVLSDALKVTPAPRSDMTPNTCGRPDEEDKAVCLPLLAVADGTLAPPRSC